MVTSPQEKSMRIRFLNICFSLLLFVKERGCCINILPLWDLCKGHYNSLREKTLSVSQCGA